MEIMQFFSTFRVFFSLIFKFKMIMEKKQRENKNLPSFLQSSREKKAEENRKLAASKNIRFLRSS
jgi:uncharacterized membrane protein